MPKRCVENTSDILRLTVFLICLILCSTMLFDTIEHVADVMWQYPVVVSYLKYTFVIICPAKLNCVCSCVCSQSFLYLAWYMIMSILGHYNNFFFAAHLLDIAMGFKTLRTILSSVTHNGKQVCVSVCL